MSSARLQVLGSVMQDGADGIAMLGAKSEANNIQRLPFKK
jgi:hypothetical protein